MKWHEAICFSFSLSLYCIQTPTNLSLSNKYNTCMSVYTWHMNYWFTNNVKRKVLYFFFSFLFFFFSFLFFSFFFCLFLFPFLYSVFVFLICIFVLLFICAFTTDWTPNLYVISRNMGTAPLSQTSQICLSVWKQGLIYKQ